MDEASRKYLLAKIPKLNDPMIRGIAWLNLWDDMLYGHTAPKEIIRLAVNALETETDILNIQRILGRIRSVYWNYLSALERIQMAPYLEPIVKQHLDQAETVSLKSSFFKTLRSITLSEEGYSWLKKIWSKTDSIPGLKFSERDYISMATELALREKLDSQEILVAQLDLIKNPDRKARFEFVIPALSSDETIRDAFFETLKIEENRAREPWVQQAVGYLNHPLRAGSSEKYIRPGLELLEEIQRTGDIFFPARWVSAILSGHQSDSAVKIVTKFLEDYPDYSPRLKLKILQAADQLFRAAKIVN
jgi:aminopeptidase N